MLQFEPCVQVKMTDTAGEIMWECKWGIGIRINECLVGEQMAIGYAKAKIYE